MPGEGERREWGEKYMWSEEQRREAKQTDISNDDDDGGTHRQVDKLICASLL